MTTNLFLSLNTPPHTPTLGYIHAIPVNSCEASPTIFPATSTSKTKPPFFKIRSELLIDIAYTIQRRKAQRMRWNIHGTVLPDLSAERKEMR